MKIIILLLFFPPFSSSYWFDCSPCNCLINENDLKTANCNKNTNVPDLQEIPENLDKEVIILKFKEQSLSVLQENHFIEFQNLHEIYLNQNKIKVIHENALKGLNNLTKLDLCYNELTILSVNLFSNTPKLTYLWINNNKLTELQQNMFTNLLFLNEIHLQENSIQKVTQNCFVNVPSLTVIDLSYNNLQSLQLNIIDDITSIKYFILHENPWICDNSLCEFRETALQNNWLTTIADCNNMPDKSWKDIKNYTVNIVANQTTVKEEENIEFLCEYYSCITSKLIWQSNHKELKQTESLRKEDKYISVLTLKNVDKSDEGTYICSVNGCNDCLDSQIYLNVTEKPKKATRIAVVTEEIYTTQEIDTTTTSLPETTTENSSSGVNIALAISFSLAIAIILACCCCCCCCRTKCLFFYRKIFKRKRNSDKEEGSEQENETL